MADLLLQFRQISTSNSEINLSIKVFTVAKHSGYDNYSEITDSKNAFD